MIDGPSSKRKLIGFEAHLCHGGVGGPIRKLSAEDGVVGVTVCRTQNWDETDDGPG